jgi:hypothetical protein
MNRLYNLIGFPHIFLYTVKALWVQRNFIKKNLDPILKEFQEDNYTDLTNSDIKKIRHYYGYAVPAILGEGFCILRGKRLSETERIALTCLGALTGIYDDFFDKLDTPESHILKLTTNPNEKIARNIHELLFVKFFNLALENCPATKLIRQKFIEVYKAQLLSKKQKTNKLTQEEMSSITFTKGGVSLLFYRSALVGQADDNEEKLLYLLGGLMQLENDIFDIYKDYQENLATLATTTKNISELRKVYVKLYNEIVPLVNQTHFARENKLFFLRFISLVIHRGSVCLDCLERNESLSNGAFVIQDYDRKQLICDMEKFKNLFRVFRYFINSKISALK